jgi:hypothetical protein
MESGGFCLGVLTSLNAKPKLSPRARVCHRSPRTDRQIATL